METAISLSYNLDIVNEYFCDCGKIGCANGESAIAFGVSFEVPNELELADYFDFISVLSGLDSRTFGEGIVTASRGADFEPVVFAADCKNGLDFAIAVAETSRAAVAALEARS